MYIQGYTALNERLAKGSKINKTMITITLGYDAERPVVTPVTIEVYIGGVVKDDRGEVIHW